MTRLTPDLEREAARLQTKADGYRLAGSHDLYVLTLRAKGAVTLLLSRMEELASAEAVARDEVPS